MTTGLSLSTRSSIAHSSRANRNAAMTQAIPDLLVRMMDVSEDSVQCVRKTAEVPPRVSVYDVLGVITGLQLNNSLNIFQRLCNQFPEVTTLCSNFRFPGRGQRDTPVTDAEGIVTIVMLLPGRAAAMARQYAANVLVRYVGGDLILVREASGNPVGIQWERGLMRPASVDSAYRCSGEKGNLPEEG